MDHKRKIFKYPLRVGLDEQTIEMSVGFELRHVGLDPTGQPCVWAEVWENYPHIAEVRFFICGTGHNVPLGADFVGSFIDGPFVWHVYARASR